MNSTKRIALFSGSFDPITMGHLDLIKRASFLFDELIIAVGTHPSKQAFFTIEERIEMIERSLLTIEAVDNFNVDNIQVTAYQGLTVDFALEMGAGYLVRGLRLPSDLDYEYPLQWMNQRLSPELETVFLVASSKWLGVSSSFVKELARHGGDLSRFVPEPVLHYFKK